MKTRVISGIAAFLLLMVVVLSGQKIFAVGLFLLSLIAVYEFYSAIQKGGHRPIKFVGYLACISVLLVGLNGAGVGIDIGAEKMALWNSFEVFILMLALLSVIVFKHEEYHVTDIALTLFGVGYVVFLFCFVALTRTLPGGFWLIWFVFIGAWATDTAAYFAGVTLGKTKILPLVSPTKSLEGSIGGILGCVVITVLFGTYVSHQGFTMPIALYHLVILGLLNGILSQIGDWTASAIKRYMKIKDYGNIMPGHGGVLDRFDSVLIIAPMVYFYFSFIIMK